MPVRNDNKVRNVEGNDMDLDPNDDSMRGDSSRGDISLHPSDAERDMGSSDGPDRQDHNGPSDGRSRKSSSSRSSETDGSE